jgi:hypothetical protein
MGMLEDVMKALDRWPLWKRIQGLPDELEQLRERIESLERRLAPATGDQCPRCREMTFRLVDTKPLPGPVGALGAMQDHFHCSSCDYKTQRKSQ